MIKPEMKLTRKEEQQVKDVARGLLTRLKGGKLVLDWRKRQQSRAQVQVTINEILDHGLPHAYTPELFQRKCDSVYHHVFECYYGAGASVYAMTA